MTATSPHCGRDLQALAGVSKVIVTNIRARDARRPTLARSAVAYLALGAAAVVAASCNAPVSDGLLLSSDIAPLELPARVLYAPAESPRANQASFPVDANFSDREQTLAWVHPLAGPRRRLPGNASRTFGAKRPGDRNRECRKGHCGVDLGQRKGEIVHAAADGVLTRVVTSRGGASGRYLRIKHPSGYSTYYMHLHRIRRDLELGDEVRAGEPIGTVGRTGVKNSGPHLHFGVSRPANGGEHFIDPEPMLRDAALLSKPVPLSQHSKPTL